MYELLLSPMKIGSMTVKNRTVMTAAEFSLGQTNGKPTERLMDYYEERAKGGAAEDFAAKYRKLTGSDSDEVPPQAPFAYTAAKILVHGLVAARGSKSAVMKSIDGLKDFPSVLGPVSYDGEREIVLPLFVKTFGPDGRNVLVDDTLWQTP